MLRILDLENTLSQRLEAEKGRYEFYKVHDIDKQKESLKYIEANQDTVIGQYAYVNQLQEFFYIPSVLVLFSIALTFMVHDIEIKSKMDQLNNTAWMGNSFQHRIKYLSGSFIIILMCLVFMTSSLGIASINGFISGFTVPIQQFPYFLNSVLQVSGLGALFIHFFNMCLGLIFIYLVSRFIVSNLSYKWLCVMVALVFVDSVWNPLNLLKGLGLFEGPLNLQPYISWAISFGFIIIMEVNMRRLLCLKKK